jgi:hypothetical protein
VNDRAAGNADTGALTTDAHGWTRTGREISIEPFGKNGGKRMVKLVRFEIFPRESVPILVIRGHPPSLRSRFEAQGPLAKNLGVQQNETYIYLITLNDGTTIQFQFGLK